MSDSPPQPENSAAAPPPPRSGWMTAFMLIAGIILLLPGLCAVIFGAASLYSLQSDFMPFVVVGLVVGAGGGALIRAALRGRRP